MTRLLTMSRTHALSCPRASMRTSGLVTVLSFALCVLFFNSSEGHDRLASLPARVCTNDAASLELAIKTGVETILVPQGTYLINNPLMIDRDGLLFVFGAGRLRTRMIARNPGAPLIIIKHLDRLSLLGMELAANGATGDVPLLESSNRQPLTLEIQDCLLRHGGLRLAGPGRTIVQGTHFQGERDARLKGSLHGVVVDHPGAELFMVAGNMSGRAGSHVLQREGHVEIYGTGLQSHGTADITIMEPSPRGAHIIAAVRSEGTKSSAPSVFLRVPRTRSAVDIVLKTNNFSSPKIESASGNPCQDEGPADVFAEYHASGRIWLLGNFCHANVRTLVSADNPRAMIVAIGNASKGCVNPHGPASSLFRLHDDATLVDAYNVYDHEAVTQEQTNPRRRFVNPSHRLMDYDGLPHVPDNANDGSIPKLDRPVISSEPPKEFLRSVRDFANDPSCRGASDDTCYLQLALDRERARLYFPAGTYSISKPLRLNQRGEEAGGMLAGAGSGATRIVSRADSVLTTDGMAYVTIQGMSLVATNPGGAVVGLEWPESLGGQANPYVATQGNNFYDVRFEGGKYGLGIGRLSPRQCSENLIVDSTFMGSHIGLAVGHYNALANILHGVRFLDTDWNVGFSDEGLGGTWAVFDAEAQGTRSGVIHRFAVGRNLYHNHFRSDGPQLLSIGWNSNESIVFFEHSEFARQAAADPFMDFNAGQGILFLRSQVNSGVMRFGASGAAAFLLSLQSRLSGPIHAAEQPGCRRDDPIAAQRRFCFAFYDEFPPARVESRRND